jgi:phosphoribosyl 1,2-cyclic phosphodiesterase
MQVTFWGTRGSIAAPGPKTMRYGGNTSCVEVLLEDGTRLIFDAGTGIRPLGHALLAQPGPVRVHLFLSHAHWDHIQGIPFFAPAYVEGTELSILGPEHGRLTLEKVVTDQMRSPYFPIPMHAMGAKITFVKLGEGSVVELPGATIEAAVVNHPGCTLGYRLTAEGRCSSIRPITNPLVLLPPPGIWLALPAMCTWHVTPTC